MKVVIIAGRILVNSLNKLNSSRRRCTEGSLWIRASNKSVSKQISKEERQMFNNQCSMFKFQLKASTFSLYPMHFTLTIEH